MSVSGLVPCPCCFGGGEVSFSSSRVVFVGVPVEVGGVGRPGVSLAPCAVRRASSTLVYWSVFGGRGLPRDIVYDAGDVQGSLEGVVGELARVAGARGGRGLFVVGGVHSIVLGVVEAMVGGARDPLLVVFDAHMDAVPVFRGSRLASPCTVLRAAERLGGERVVLVGVRVGSEAELERLEALGVRILGLEELEEGLGSLVEGRDWVHFSIDVDVFDPALAPGASNPEPFGVEPVRVARLVYRAARLLGPRLTVDFVEYTPLFDPGMATAYLAARLVLEYAAGILESSVL